MSTTVQVACPACGGINRLPEARLGERPNCGRCHQPLFTGQPIAADADTFERHVGRGDLPVLVDFWAPWCGPCRMMAPAFDAAARTLSPDVRLLKVNTEEQQALAARYAIRSIPTLILFENGREKARSSGAMNESQLVHWVRSQG
ncbi:thioredoxin TrxC [Nitrogeniibacter mangrovi]|uniref:Thioredoxin n=1 Tax=Nitrogeniibacter mangrovi TaxID=2016596 RepID=A0A6C1B3N4_9RHOO|nr:thioredoxin TrxC [Nitrogeniibacter mangrovi]QID18167.1 thioredoxin TrxC [Nitrogeniibacter mangrovi]